jgi:hypothetical protein
MSLIAALIAMAAASMSQSRMKNRCWFRFFRLDKAALTECLRLAIDIEEKASMRRGR